MYYFFTTITIFFLCNSFQTIHFLRWSYRDKNDETYYKKYLKPYWHISHFLMVFNCSIMSIIYTIFSKKFRQLFIEKFCCKSKEIQMSNSTFNLKCVKSSGVKSRDFWKSWKKLDIWAFFKFLNSCFWKWLDFIYRRLVF